VGQQFGNRGLGILRVEGAIITHGTLWATPVQQVATVDEAAILTDPGQQRPIGGVGRLELWPTS